MNCQFSFAPNRGYFFCAGGSAFAWSDNSLPGGLTRLLGTDHPQALAIPYDIAFPMESGLYALCWKTTGGEDWYEDECLGPNYTRLARFIKNVARTEGNPSRTVFGPGYSYFSISPSGFSWQNLPSGLEDDIQTCIKTRQPTNVALGVEGSYVVLYSDGTVTFDLRKQYPLVETLLRDVPEVTRRRGVTYLALNPFVAGEFYVVYGDASTSWNLPKAWSEDVTDISKSIQPIASANLASAPGGTAPKVRPVEVSLGGTGGKVQAQEVSPPPAYAAQAQTSAAPAQRPAAASKRPAAPPAAEKFNWKQGLELGLQAAEGISKIINAFEGENGDEQQEESYDQVVFQETIYADGTVVDTATYWENNQ